MAVDVFLKIGDIKGESLDDKHKGEIEIESFSFGQAADASETGQRSGKVDLQDFHFVMRVGKATPELMKRCAEGAHIKHPLSDEGKIPDATLVVRSAGARQNEFLKIKFYDLMISSFQHGVAQADVVLTDQFSMWFAKIELEIAEQRPDGTLGASTFFKYDRIKGETY